MDRGIIYPGQIPLETDLLFAQKSSMVGLAKLAAAMFGTSTIVNGLAVTPNSPAALNVLVGPGEVYALTNIDGTAYSSIAADTTHSIVKQGISLDTQTIACAAPGTVGFSINYLIQATFAEVDGTPVALPYYNASNPATAYSGPNNSGTAQNTRRAGTVIVSAKAGTAAATGTQTTPAPDSGYVGIAVVTVANGQSTITSGNITAYSSAPVLPSAGVIIGGFQQDLFNTAKAGGTSDAITASFAPAITSTTLASGIVTVTVYPTAANATTTPNFTPNSGVVSPAAIVKGNNQALVIGDIAGANHPIVLMWNPTATNWVLLNPATGINVSSYTSRLGNVGATVASNALTVTIGTEMLDFRSATATSGTPVARTASSQGSLTVPSTATLGSQSGVQSTLVWGWLDNAGTLEPFIGNMIGGVNLDETQLISTTAMSTLANSANVLYSASARTNVAFRIRGFCNITEATAGAWVTAPTLVGPAGGRALSPLTIQGCKAWVNFDGTATGTITPRSNYNVSSVTKVGTGVYTVNFTNALTDANYSATASAGTTGGSDGGYVRIGGTSGSTYSTSAISLVVLNSTAAGVFDANRVCLNIFGN